MTIGLFGGTFDPVHRGHLDVARAARNALALDQIWFVPARLPPHRAEPHASAAHRFAMVALAIADQDGLLLSDVEMDTAGPSYTIDTLDRVVAMYPSMPQPLIFITGADAFQDIRSWRAYADVLNRCHFVVVSRPGHPAHAVRAALPDLADRMHDAPCTIPPTPSIFLVEAATAAVSSTGIRRAMKTGQSLTGLVPSAVASYAVKHRLYVDGDTREHTRE